MDPTISEIRLFAGNFAPQYWALCQGQLLSISQNTALFSLVGTTYGGDGQTTFALPNFGGRFALGTGQGAGLSPVELGEASGNGNVTLLQSNLAQHNHNASYQFSGGAGNSTSPVSNYPATGSGTTSDGVAIQLSYASSSPDQTMMGAIQVGVAGQSLPVPVTNPFLVLNYIIAVEGIFPSRN